MISSKNVYIIYRAKTRQDKTHDAESLGVLNLSRQELSPLSDRLT